ncbi:response regulator [bacterium]|nr:response regulator [bacterium]
MLTDFKDKDMIEQISLLTTIQETADTSALSDLLRIYEEPLVDPAVDKMVYHALLILLPDHRQEIMSGLLAKSRRVRLLSIKMAGVSGIDDALLPLKKMLADNRDDVEIQTVIIRSLTMLNGPEIIDILLPYLDHDDLTISGTIMAYIGYLQHLPGRDMMMEVVRTEAKSASDSLRSGLALAQFNHFQDNDSIAFLIEQIHHLNPGLRLICHEQLLAIGAPSLPALESCLADGDKNERILAANLIGMIGDLNGAGLACRLLYRRTEPEPNLRFALYEALGKISATRSLVTLMDGLKQTDDLLLMAVITGLEEQSDESLYVPLLTFLAENEIQANLIIQAMIDTRSTHLLGLVYRDEELGEIIMERLLDSNDPEATELFSQTLKELTGTRVVTDLKRLQSLSASNLSDTHLLVADDSKALLFFYQGAAKEMGLQITTALDGKKALEILDSGVQLDILITDMNMPNMDGIELIREVRKRPQYSDLPIIMATTESEQSQKEQALEAGANGFLNKPLKREILKEEIQKRISP